MDHEERRHALSHDRAELLGRSGPDVARREHPAHRRLERPVGLDEAPPVEVDLPLHERGVRIQPDEHERPRRVEREARRIRLRGGVQPSVQTSTRAVACGARAVRPAGRRRVLTRCGSRVRIPSSAPSNCTSEAQANVPIERRRGSREAGGHRRQEPPDAHSAPPLQLEREEGPLVALELAVLRQDDALSVAERLRSADHRERHSLPRLGEPYGPVEHDPPPL